MNGSFRYPGDLFPDLSRLHQHLDDFFQTGASASIRALSRNTFPAVNVGSSPESIEVLAFAPGVEQEALQITVDRGLLVIAGERRSTPREGASGADQRPRDNKDVVYAQERFDGSFRRVISLPDDADPAKVEATLRDGVLRISIAKRESSKPRRIAVN